MEAMNRRSALSIGAAAIAGLAAFPLVSQTASAEEHRWRRIHDAIEALRSARDEIESTGHEWGGHKAEAMKAIDNATHHLQIMEKWHE